MWLVNLTNRSVSQQFSGCGRVAIPSAQVAPARTKETIMNKDTLLIRGMLSLALLAIPIIASAANAPSTVPLVKDSYPTLTTGALASARLAELPTVPSRPASSFSAFAWSRSCWLSYGVQFVRVQVFFDKNGKEVVRHVGFFLKEEVVAKLAELGVK